MTFLFSTVSFFVCLLFVLYIYITLMKCWCLFKCCFVCFSTTQVFPAFLRCTQIYNFVLAFGNTRMAWWHVKHSSYWSEMKTYQPYLNVQDCLYSQLLCSTCSILKFWMRFASKIAFKTVSWNTEQNRNKNVIQARCFVNLSALNNENK